MRTGKQDRKEHRAGKRTKSGATATIDAAGRLVIPKAIRAGAGFEAGTLLEIHLEQGRVVLEPAPRRVTIRQREGFYVAEPTDGTGPAEDTLTQRQVEETVRRVREGEGDP